MSEDVKPPCVRGCTKPILDPNTREKIGDEPRPATQGHLCGKCAEKLRKWLKDIPDLYAVLDPRISRANNSNTAPANRRKISGSPALIRLDVAILQDPRTHWGSQWRGKSTMEPEDRYDPPSDIPSQFITWAYALADDLNLTQQPTTLTEAIELLTGPWWSNLCYRPWIDELFTDTQTTRRLLRRVTGTNGPRPLGKCQCGNTLYEPIPVPGATNIDPERAILECGKCGHRMNSMAIVRLAAAQRVAQ